jgi:tetratricopeptide (TPR) repeat protein
MNSPSHPAAADFAAALALHRQGALDAAATGYAAILADHPEHVPSNCCLCLCRIQGGRVGEALGLGRRAATLAPDAGEAWHGLGNAFAAAGDLAQAAAGFRRMVTQRPHTAEGHNNLGNVLLLLDNPKDARRSFRAAVALRPDYPEAWFNLGNLHGAGGQPQQAETAYARAAAGKPGFLEAGTNRANLLTALGRYRDAAAGFRAILVAAPNDAFLYESFAAAQLASAEPLTARLALRRAARITPTAPTIHQRLGSALEDLGQSYPAIVCGKTALVLDPALAAAHYGLGCSMATLERDQEARSCFDTALILRPDFAEAHNNLGRVLLAEDRQARAKTSFRRAVALLPDYSHPYNNLGSILQSGDLVEEAAACYRRAARLDPLDAVPLNNLGIALLESGALDEAYDAFAAAVDLSPRRGRFYRTLADTGRIVPGNPYFERMEKLAEDIESLPQEEQIELHFALGKIYGDCGRHERSFRHLLTGNGLKRQTTQYREGEALELFARIRAAFPRELPSGAARPAARSPRPVFVVGMPRSGTSLVEQILASHPLIFGAGELPDLRRLTENIAPFPEATAAAGEQSLRRLAEDYLAVLRARAPAAQLVVDKMPANFQLIGLIRMALPEALIIHVRRDPVDTCLSCFARLFAGELPYSYDLAELGRYYRAYEELMRHWRQVVPAGAMLELAYEDLVGDLEGEARRLLDHCGVPWDPACLQFHRTRRPVRTASAAQVRRQLYAGAIGRWHVYGDLAGPLIEALAI